MKPYLITAIGTPLSRDELLQEEGLQRQLADQSAAKIDGLLVGGTMGMMQMLRDETYRNLARRSVELSRGQHEILVGAGDAGYARTRERIEFLNTLNIDGIVVLTPYFVQFTQSQLAQYFQALADVAKKPLYLYDLPSVTNVPISMETYEKVAKHPNIKGAKISGRMSFTRQLIDRLGDRFRAIVAEPDMLDVLMRHGVEQHLDGMFAIAPQWVMRIAASCAKGDWHTAAEYQQKLTALRNLLVDDETGMGVFTSLMNARGIPGSFASAPFGHLSPERHEQLLSNPIVRELVSRQN